MFFLWAPSAIPTDRKYFMIEPAIWKWNAMETPWQAHECIYEDRISKKKQCKNPYWCWVWQSKRGRRRERERERRKHIAVGLACFRVPMIKYVYRARKRFVFLSNSLTHLFSEGRIANERERINNNNNTNSHNIKQFQSNHSDQKPKCMHCTFRLMHRNQVVYTIWKCFLIDVVCNWDTNTVHSNCFVARKFL